MFKTGHQYIEKIESWLNETLADIKSRAPSILGASSNTYLKLIFNLFIGMTLYTVFYLTHENIDLYDQAHRQSQKIQEFEQISQNLDLFYSRYLLSLEAGTKSLNKKWFNRALKVEKIYFKATKPYLIKLNDPEDVLGLEKELNQVSKLLKKHRRTKPGTPIYYESLKKYKFALFKYHRLLIESLRANKYPVNAYLSYLKGKVENLDTVLTMSTVNASLTGNLEWEDIYKKSEVYLDLVLDKVHKYAPDIHSHNGSHKTQEANTKLIALEKMAFKAVKNKDLKLAQQILESDEYFKNKAIYQTGMIEVKESIDIQASRTEERTRKQIESKVFYFFIIAVGLFIGWVTVTLIFKETRKIREKTFQNLKLISIGELAAGIGHEINNPLTILKSRIDELSKNNSEIDPALILSQKQATQRIEEIVRGLRTYARIDNTEQIVFSGNGLIKNSIQLIYKIYSHEGIHLCTDLNATSDKLMGAPGRFQQVILNILSNAKDALKEVSQKRIIVKTYNMSEGFICEITDNGPGIPPDLHGKIFESFFTTKQMGQGVGLGLSISQSIVTEFKGTLDFKSKPGRGTTFKIILPYLSNENLYEENPAHLTGGPENKEMDKFFAKKRALVIDDEPEIKEILASYLQEANLDVDTASNGLQGLEYVEKHQYDYIFTDIKMPYMLGDEFIEKAKKIHKGNPRYYVVSGGLPQFNYSPNGKPLEEMEEQIIFKPFDRKTILDILNSSLSLPTNPPHQINKNRFGDKPSPSI